MKRINYHKTTERRYLQMRINRWIRILVAATAICLFIGLKAAN